MQRLVLLQAASDDPEIAVLRLEAGDHEQFLQDPLTFVNHYKIFCTDVSDVRFLPPSTQAGESSTRKMAKLAETGAPCFAIIVHYPACVCRAFCVSASEPVALGQ